MNSSSPFFRCLLLLLAVFCGFSVRPMYVLLSGSLSSSLALLRGFRTSASVFPPLPPAAHFICAPLKYSFQYAAFRLMEFTRLSRQPFSAAARLPKMRRPWRPRWGARLSWNFWISLSFALIFAVRVVRFTNGGHFCALQGVQRHLKWSGLL